MLQSVLAGVDNPRIIQGHRSEISAIRIADQQTDAFEKRLR